MFVLQRPPPDFEPDFHPGSLASLGDPSGSLASHEDEEEEGAEFRFDGEGVEVANPEGIRDFFAGERSASLLKFRLCVCEPPLWFSLAGASDPKSSLLSIDAGSGNPDPWREIFGSQQQQQQQQQPRGRSRRSATAEELLDRYWGDMMGDVDFGQTMKTQV